MLERSLVQNGRFLHQLSPWSGSAVYSAGDGDEHYGVAVLAVGASLSQDFTAPLSRIYTLAISVKPLAIALVAAAATAVIRDGFGSLVKSIDLSGSADVWTDLRFTIGLVPGTTYELEITNVSHAAGLRIDDVWLWPIVATRAQLVGQVHRRLSDLASDASLSYAPSYVGSEGDYTDAVNAGLRAAGAIDPETDLPDVRWLDAGNQDACMRAIEREMLERLQRKYAILTDISTLDRDEKLSQITTNLAKLTSSAPGSGSASRQVRIRPLKREANDYELG